MRVWCSNQRSLFNLAIKEFKGNLCSGWLLLESQFSTALPSILGLCMIRVELESLHKSLFSFLILLLLFENSTNVDIGFRILIIILS
jgi:hypothetical protein